jgi:3-hydroxyisobutyrate dehydrogenase-like beta-hydroxyacid dehydrogenase
VKKDYLPAQGTFESLSHYFDYIDDLAASAGSATPLFHVAATLFRRGIEDGLAEHDVAAVVEVVNQISSQEKPQ